MPDLVFIIYPETYAALSEYRRIARLGLDTEEHRRISGIISAWDAALQEHGDVLAKVELFHENGHLTFHAYEKTGWDWSIAADDDDL